MARLTRPTVVFVLIQLVSICLSTTSFLLPYQRIKPSKTVSYLNEMLTSHENEEAKSIVLIGVTCDTEKDTSPILREGITDLFKLYFDELYELGCDLGFQGFQSEWTDLPGKYDFEKRGGIFVAVEVPLNLKASENSTNNNVLLLKPGMNLPFLNNIYLHN